MNYIGSKRKLSDFIISNIKKVAGDLEGKVFAEIFGGTGIISRKIKTQVKKLIVNDLESYSNLLLKNYIGNNQEIDFEPTLEILQNVPEREGFIYQNYCLGSGSERQYFSDSNGKKIDAIRQKIEELELSENLYYFLLACLLESVDKVANTASVYGAFLKDLKPSAQKELVLKAAEFDIQPNQKNEVYQEDANSLIHKIEGDILYLDPPYNARQYGANYHLLNTIALYDDFEPQGKTGLRSYERSRYCQKNEVENAFEELLEAAQFRYIFISYNNEGLLAEEKLKSLMEKFGKYHLEVTDYQRFKADKTENRNHKFESTVEHLHILEKTI